MNWGTILVIIGLIIFVVWLSAGLSLSIQANKQCKSACELKEAVAYHVEHSGNWRVDDICICYHLNDSIDIFRLGLSDGRDW